LRLPEEVFTSTSIAKHMPSAQDDLTTGGRIFALKTSFSRGVRVRGERAATKTRPGEVIAPVQARDVVRE